MSKHVTRLFALAVALLVVVAGTGAVFAATASVGAKAQTQIKVVYQNSQTASFSTKSTVYADIPNATVSMTVPASTTALLVARFQAHGSIIQTSGCIARVLVGSTAMEPSGNYPIFGQASVSQSVATGGSIERSLALGAGTYTVKAQMRIGSASSVNSECQLNGWHLAVERHKR